MKKLLSLGVILNVVAAFSASASEDLDKYVSPLEGMNDSKCKNGAAIMKEWRTVAGNRGKGTSLKNGEIWVFQWKELWNGMKKLSAHQFCCNNNPAFGWEGRNEVCDYYRNTGGCPVTQAGPGLQGDPQTQNPPADPPPPPQPPQAPTENFAGVFDVEGPGGPSITDFDEEASAAEEIQKARNLLGENAATAILAAGEAHSKNAELRKHQEEVLKKTGRTAATEHHQDKFDGGSVNNANPPTAGIGKAGTVSTAGNLIGGNWSDKKLEDAAKRAAYDPNAGAADGGAKFDAGAEGAPGAGRMGYLEGSVGTGMSEYDEYGNAQGRGPASGNDGNMFGIATNSRYSIFDIVSQRYKIVCPRVSP